MVDTIIFNFVFLLFAMAHCIIFNFVFYIQLWQMPCPTADDGFVAAEYFVSFVLSSIVYFL
jgi:hypothetical protein